MDRTLQADSLFSGVIAPLVNLTALSLSVSENFRAQSQNYLDPLKSLSEHFLTAVKDNHISPLLQNKMVMLLEPLKRHHFPSYEHSLRVAIIAGSIAGTFDGDRRSLFVAGALHDIGKTDVPFSVLEKTENFGKNDYELMRPHVEIGYDCLTRAGLTHAANIMVAHHCYMIHRYPERLPQLSLPYNEQSLRTLVRQRRWLALADHYDALHRKNDRNGAGLSGEQIKERMLSDNADVADSVFELYERGVFTTAIYSLPH